MKKVVKNILIFSAILMTAPFSTLHAKIVDNFNHFSELKSINFLFEKNNSRLVCA